MPSGETRLAGHRGGRRLWRAPCRGRPSQGHPGEWMVSRACTVNNVSRRSHSPSRWIPTRKPALACPRNLQSPRQIPRPSRSPTFAPCPHLRSLICPLPPSWTTIPLRTTLSLSYWTLPPPHPTTPIYLKSPRHSLSLSLRKYMCRNRQLHDPDLLVTVKLVPHAPSLRLHPVLPSLLCILSLA